MSVNYLSSQFLVSTMKVRVQLDKPKESATTVSLLSVLCVPMSKTVRTLKIQILAGANTGDIKDTIESKVGHF